VAPAVGVAPPVADPVALVVVLPVLAAPGAASAVTAALTEKFWIPVCAAGPVVLALGAGAVPAVGAPVGAVVAATVAAVGVMLTLVAFKSAWYACSAASASTGSSV
jgi:hypothetical protein